MAKPAAGGVKICPACGARNKAKWEFCIRCSESLADSTIVAEAVAAGPPEAAEEALVEAGFPWGSALGLLIVLVGGAYVATNYRGDVFKPDPGIFAAPLRTAPTPPPAAGYVAPPGTRKLAEGLSLLQRGDIAGAMAALAQAVAEAPENPAAHYYYAQALWRAENREQAVSEYREAVRLSPRSVLYRSDLGRTLGLTGKTPEAIAEFETVLRERPDSPGFMRELSGLYEQAGNMARVAELRARAVELQPQSILLRQDLAHSLEKAGRTEEAVNTYKEILNLEPKASVSRGLLAEALFKQDRKDEAIALLREGVAVDPASPLARRSLGSLLERTGRIKEAIAEYREYARLAPSARDAKPLAERAASLEERAKGSS